MKKHKEDLITPPWAFKVTPEEQVPTATLWLTKNGKTVTITKPLKEIPHWRQKYQKDYVVTDTDPALDSSQVGHCGHECFRLHTGMGCSRCKE